jgi:hypothetical protein
MRFLLLFHRSLYMQVRQTSSGSSIQNSGALPREGEASQAGPRPRMHSMQEGNSAAVSSSMPTQATQAAQSANSQSTREVRALFRQTPFENVRQHDVQLFDKAFNSSGIDPHIGSVSPIPQGFLPHVDALGRATQDPNIRQHFQNFLGRLDERNHVISSGRQPDVPKTDGKYFGSREHIQYGREVDQYLGIGNPALAAMLNPSGGKNRQRKRRSDQARKCFIPFDPSWPGSRRARLRAQLSQRRSGIQHLCARQPLHGPSGGGLGTDLQSVEAERS